MDRLKVVIMGAAGRDFHNFNVVYRDDPAVEVVAITATQIPGIEDRRYPPELAGPLYPAGIPIVPEDELERIFASQKIDRVVFAYSDVSHEFVMHQASRALAGGANFVLLGPGPHDDPQHEAGRRHRRHPHRRRQEPDHPLPRPPHGGAGPPRRRRPSPDALRRPRQAAGPALRHVRRPRPPRDDDRGARGVRAASRRRPRPLRRRRLRGDPARGREGGRRRHLGRRQQRLPLLRARPLRRRRRPAARRPRDRSTTPARRTCGWPTSSSSTRSTAPRPSRSPPSATTSPASTRGPR